MSPYEVLHGVTIGGTSCYACPCCSRGLSMRMGVVPAWQPVINIAVISSHWITTINARVDNATRVEPHADLTWMQCRPYSTLLVAKLRDNCWLAPSNVQEWLQEQGAGGVPHSGAI